MMLIDVNLLLKLFYCHNAEFDLCSYCFSVAPFMVFLFLGRWYSTCGMTYPPGIGPWADT